MTISERAEEIITTCDQVHMLPVGKRSALIQKSMQHAFIGVSPFNSYFTEERLIQLFRWGFENFYNISIFIPDTISVFTLLARGYSEEEAKYKTRRQDSYLINKVKRALLKLNINTSKIDEIIINFSLLKNNPKYMELYEFCLSQFENNEQFKKGCLSTSSWILNNHSAIGIEKLNVAVRYFLYEFPIFLNTPYILDVPSSVFIYHSVPAYLEHLYKKNKLVSLNQGFLRVTVSD